jgi:hypothetical protein
MIVPTTGNVNGDVLGARYPRYNVSAQRGKRFRYIISISYISKPKFLKDPDDIGVCIGALRLGNDSRDSNSEDRDNTNVGSLSRTS